MVPRIARLSERELTAPDGTRFAVLHVVADERHHIGWFQLTDDPWRVGLVDAGTVVDAGVPAAHVRLLSARVLTVLRADHDAGVDDAPPPAGPITNPLRYRTDRRRAIERLQAEADALA